MKKEMTEQEKEINYFRIALGLQGISIDNEMSDRLVNTFRGVQSLGGNFSLDHAINIEMAMNKKYAAKRIAQRKRK
jgi:predicted SpoU family rRNA methylase